MKFLFLFSISQAISIKFIEGFNFDPEEHEAIELDEQEAATAKEQEKIENQDDLDLCSNVDLGDPFDDYINDGQKYDVAQDPAKAKKVDDACVLSKSRKPDSRKLI